MVPINEESCNSFSSLQRELNENSSDMILPNNNNQSINR